MAADGGAARKRKRVTPVPVGIAAPSAPAEAQQPVAPAEGPSSGNKDSTRHWELRVQDGDKSGCCVQLFHDAALKWKYLLATSVEQALVEASFAVVSSGVELHVLSVSTGALALPKLMLKSPPMQLELNAAGQLLVLGLDAELRVLDLSRQGACMVTSCLRGICEPGDVVSTRLRLTGEPVLYLTNGHLLCYRAELGSWTNLRPSSTAQVPRELLRLEGEVLAAACLGEVDEFHAKLKTLVAECTMSVPEAGYLRTWCNALVGRSTWPWLRDALRDMGLDGTKLLCGLILPHLATDSGPLLDLRAELEEVVLKTSSSHTDDGPHLKNCPIF